MRKTSIAKIHVTKTKIVASFSNKNIDCGIKDIVGEKINHEFVYEEKNDRERSKHGQQNKKNTIGIILGRHEDVQKRRN